MRTPIKFKTLARPSKPNTYLVAPEGLCQNAKVDAPSPRFTEPPSTLAERVRSVLTADASYVEVDSDSAAGRIVAVAATSPIRFLDDVDIAVLPAGEGAAIAVYSRSRVGYSDFGVNRRRVQRLLAALG